MEFANALRHVGDFFHLTGIARNCPRRSGGNAVRLGDGGGCDRLWPIVQRTGDPHHDFASGTFCAWVANPKDRTLLASLVHPPVGGIPVGAIDRAGVGHPRRFRWWGSVSERHFLEPNCRTHQPCLRPSASLVVVCSRSPHFLITVDVMASLVALGKRHAS